ncbi:MAG TPA: nuclear transport factor 2 family protein [Terracidiphilus sp.]|nr:nuclear transport factor 2 family protein [Terracidiphilus sp.]
MTTATLQTPASTDEAEILALLAGVRKAHLDKSAGGIAAPYAPHAAVYDLEPPLAHDGIEVGRKERWLASWETPVELEARDLWLRVSGDLAFAHGYMRMSGKKHGAERGVSFWMRETVCLERVGGAWKIVHEHTSVPFYMDASLRPAFDLEP